MLKFVTGSNSRRPLLNRVLFALSNQNQTHYARVHVNDYQRSYQ